MDNDASQLEEVEFTVDLENIEVEVIYRPGFWELYDMVYKFLSENKCAKTSEIKMKLEGSELIIGDQYLRSVLKQLLRDGKVVFAHKKYCVNDSSPH